MISFLINARVLITAADQSRDLHCFFKNLVFSNSIPANSDKQLICLLNKFFEKICSMSKLKLCSYVIDCQSIQWKKKIDILFKFLSRNDERLNSHILNWSFINQNNIKTKYITKYFDGDIFLIAVITHFM